MPIQYRLLGIFPISFFLWKGYYYHISHEGIANLLWFCNLACLWIGVAYFFRLRHILAIGLCWLCVGTPFWILDSLTTRSFTFSSFLTHIGGLCIAFIGLRWMPFPKKAGTYSFLALAVVHQLSARFTPAKQNINLSQKVWSGWEQTFPNYSLYLLLLASIAMVVFWGVGKLLFLTTNHFSQRKLH